MGDEQTGSKGEASPVGDSVPEATQKEVDEALEELEREDSIVIGS